jgi:hydroxymethylpyrimidine pyrophosphatase-like HAD family hydrolase
VAVGDDENDRAMFRVAGMCVAVANAVESLKAEADRVMRRPCGEGVVELVREHLLASP